MTYALGYLNNFDWGCSAGVHKGWALIEAESESQALWSVPILIRNKARAIKLEKFYPSLVGNWPNDE